MLMKTRRKESEGGDNRLGNPFAFSHNKRFVLCTWEQCSCDQQTHVTNGWREIIQICTKNMEFDQRMKLTNRSSQENCINLEINEIKSIYNSTEVNEYTLYSIIKINKFQVFWLFHKHEEKWNAIVILVVVPRWKLK